MGSMVQKKVFIKRKRWNFNINGKTNNGILLRKNS